jgi:predicted transcriptional regulator of viral defense system
MKLKFTKEALSHTEQKVYLFLESVDKNVFSLGELKEMDLGISYGHLRVLLHNLERKGWIASVGKGVYLRLPASTIIEGRVYLEDPYLVAQKMFDGYLAFQSALRIHGLSEYEPFTVFIATKTRSETVTLLKEYEIRAVKLGQRYAGYERQGEYRVSSIAKTFYDCFWRSSLAGGMPEVLKSLYHCDKIDWQEFIKYLKKFASDSLCQRIGYQLSLLKRETSYEIPKDVINYLKSRISNKSRLDPTQGSGKLDKNWLIIDNVGKEKLLSWWYHG